MRLYQNPRPLNPQPPHQLLPNVQLNQLNQLLLRHHPKTLLRTQLRPNSTTRFQPGEAQRAVFLLSLGCLHLRRQ